MTEGRKKEDGRRARRAGVSDACRSYLNASVRKVKVATDLEIKTSASFSLPLFLLVGVKTMMHDDNEVLR